jgi:hypothetical protein
MAAAPPQRNPLKRELTKTLRSSRKALAQP